MKTKLLAGLLIASLAFTAIPNGMLTVHAAEVDAYTLDVTAINQSQSDEISVGDKVYAWGCLKDTNGNELDVDKWNFVEEEGFKTNDIDRLFYSDYSDIANAENDMVAFEDTVPEEAFGKWIYVYCGGYLVADPQHAVWAYAPSKYRVTKWDSSKSYTVAQNKDEKSVTVFTIQNSRKSGKKISFPSSMKVNGQNYKITIIGDYALDNSKGTGITAVALPSTVTSVGKEAFKDAENLKTITIEGNLKSVGKNAFSGINKKAVFKIKATKANYKKIVSKIKKAGAPKSVTYKLIK